MSDVIKDVTKHVASPLMKFQKKLRKKAVKWIEPTSKQGASNNNTITTTAHTTSDEHNGNDGDGDGERHTLYSIRHWDVTVNKVYDNSSSTTTTNNNNNYSPASLWNKIGIFGNKKRRRRRVTIEIYKKTTPEQRAHYADRERRIFKKLYAGASFRVGTSSSSASSVGSVGNGNPSASKDGVVDYNAYNDTIDDIEDDDFERLEDDDFVVFRILKQAKTKRTTDHTTPTSSTANCNPNSDSHSQYSHSQSDDSDDDSQYSSSSLKHNHLHHHRKNGDLHARFLTTYNTSDYGDAYTNYGDGHHNNDNDTVVVRWKERYRARLESTQVVDTTTTTSDDTNGSEPTTTANESDTTTVRLRLAPGVVRDVCFDTVHQVETFSGTFQKMNELQHERGSRMVAELFHSTSTSNGTGDNADTATSTSTSTATSTRTTNGNDAPSTPTNSNNTIANLLFSRSPLLAKIPENDNDNDSDQYSVATANTNANATTNDGKGKGIFGGIFGKNNNSNNNNNDGGGGSNNNDNNNNNNDGGGGSNNNNNRRHTKSSHKKTPVPQQSVNLLVEIVSATNLPIADITSSDPYVIVQDGRKEWHRTDVISKSLNPVWTLSTGSLFLIQTTLKEFFGNGAGRVEFTVKDYDSVGENDVLGSVLVPKKDMLEGKGERLEYPMRMGSSGLVTASSGSTEGKKSFLSLRCRTATQDEINFLRAFEAKKNSGVFRSIGRSSRLTGVFAKDCCLPPRSHRAKLMKRQQRKAEDGSKAIQYRLKPSADPSRPEQETKWLTQRQIERESQKSSQKWIEAGSGTVGKFYMEIIGCDGLPNLDISIMGRNKSDPFVCIAFEDCVVNTDVVNDCLSPRWMPWTQRAFVFNVMHPSSQFYIAAMDYNEVVPGNQSQCDKLGRCIVNPTNVRPNTMYTIRMSLFTSDDTDRQITGKIVIRLRYESSDERQLLLSAFQFRNHYDVSTNRKTDFATTKYALTNDYDYNSLSLETIQKYVDELLEYLDLFDDIVDAIKNIILWRGHFPLELSFCKKKYTYTFKAPCHSMIAFAWAILLSNNFDRIIAFIFFSPAWCLLGTLESRRANPNPWKKPRTYLELIGILLFNKSYARHRIKENENVEEIIEYDERRRELMKFRKDAIETVRIQNEIDAKHLEQESKELDKQAHDSSANNMNIGFNQIILTPFKDILLPVQLLLYQSVVISRVATSIVCWYDCVAAFWIVTIALVLCFTAFFIPWAFLFHWTFTIVAWTFLGPWMKLVDIFFIDNVDNMTYIERKALVEADYKKRYDSILGESKIIRLLKENSMKMRDMEKYMFGQYVARFPIFKEERFRSIPLSGGSAVPILDPSTLPPVNIVRRINGQRLQGEMIPKREHKAKEFKEAKRRETIDNSKLQQSQVPTVISTESALTKGEEWLLHVPLLGEEDCAAGDDDDGNPNHNHTGDESLLSSSHPLNLNDATTTTNYGTMEDMVHEKAVQIVNELAFDMVL